MNGRAAAGQKDASLAVTAATAVEADQVEAPAPHASPLVAAVPHADRLLASAVLSSEHGGTSHLDAGKPWAVCWLCSQAGLAVLLARLGRDGRRGVGRSGAQRQPRR